MANSYEHIGIYRHLDIAGAPPRRFGQEYFFKLYVNTPITRKDHLPLVWRCRLQDPVPKEDRIKQHRITLALDGVMNKLNDGLIQPHEISDILRPEFGYLDAEVLVSQ